MIYTAERAHEANPDERPVYARQLFAYEEVKRFIHGDVLEVGCGDAYGTKLLLPLADSYTAVDKFVSETISKLEGVDFRQMTIPPFEGIESDRFDVVISFQVIEHIQDDKAYMSEIHRVLKPGGKFIFTTPNRLMSLTRNPFHIREYIQSDYEQLCTKYTSFELKGVFGDEKAMDYYAKNKESVKAFTKFDVLNLQYRLPRWMLKIPYNIANAMNRKKLSEENADLTSGISTENYYLEDANESCLDFFCIATK
jgi:SAM-dependent methyltransferase